MAAKESAVCLLTKTRFRASLGHLHVSYQSSRYLSLSGKGQAKVMLSGHTPLFCSLNCIIKVIQRAVQLVYILMSG